MPGRMPPRRPSRKIGRPFEREPAILRPRERPYNLPGRYQRGDFILPPPVLPKELKSLGFIVHKDGRVTVPRYSPVKEEVGPIEKTGKVVVPSLDRTQRKLYHEADGALSEYQRLWETYHTVTRIHAYVVKQHIPAEEAMRTRLKNRLDELSATLTKFPQKKSKRAAKQGLSRAKELVDANNPNALRETLGGVGNSLLERLTVLGRQVPYCKRRVDAYDRKFYTEMNIRKKRIRTNEEQLAWLPVNSSARIPLLQIRKNLLVDYSKSFLLNPSLFGEVQWWKRKDLRYDGGENFRSRIIVQQANVLYENMQFWRERRETDWMAEWLRNLGNAAAPESGLRETQKHIFEAFHAAKLGQFEIVGEKLELALQKAS